MATIDNSILGGVNQTQTPKTPTTGQSGSADLQSNFMTMLITQLKNQDPLKPMDNAEMTSQLAQINMVEGVEKLNKTMTAITSQINTGQQLQATALIGKGVLVPGDRVLVGEQGVATPFGVELPKNADSVTVSIVNSGGVVARTFELGAMDAGMPDFTWDGKMADGSVAPSGAYKVKVVATAGGVPQEVAPLTYAVVNGVVKTADGGAMLDLGGTLGRVTLGEIRKYW